jgi:hypothetical protein
LPPDATLTKNFGEIQKGGKRLSAEVFYKDKMLGWLNQGIQLTSIHAALIHNHGYNGSCDSIKRLAHKIKWHH